LFAASDAAGQLREWGERAAKYVPAEITAAYLAVYGFMKPIEESCKNAEVVWGMAGFTVLCWVLCPLYIRSLAAKDEPRRLHMSMAAIAFPIWVFAIGGVHDCLLPRQPFIALVLLGAFSLISGFIAPGSKSK
jgi:hypothetical protein